MEAVAESSFQKLLKLGSKFKRIASIGDGKYAGRQPLGDNRSVPSSIGNRTGGRLDKPLPPLPERTARPKAIYWPRAAENRGPSDGLGAINISQAFARTEIRDQSWRKHNELPARTVQQKRQGGFYFGGQGMPYAAETGASRFTQKGGIETLQQRGLSRREDGTERGDGQLDAATQPGSRFSIDSGTSYAASRASTGSTVSEAETVPTEISSRSVSVRSNSSAYSEYADAREVQMTSIKKLGARPLIVDISKNSAGDKTEGARTAEQAVQYSGQQKMVDIGRTNGGGEGGDDTSPKPKPAQSKDETDRKARESRADLMRRPAVLSRG